MNYVKDVNFERTEKRRWRRKVVPRTAVDFIRQQKMLQRRSTSAGIDFSTLFCFVYAQGYFADD